MASDRRGNENFIYDMGEKICAFTFPSGDYCGLPWDHESPCRDPEEVMRVGDLIVGAYKEGFIAARDTMTASVLAALAEDHRPLDDGPMSLVKSPYCSCKAMHVYMDTDGHNSIGPVSYPCPTVQTITAVLESFGD